MSPVARPSGPLDTASRQIQGCPRRIAAAAPAVTLTTRVFDMRRWYHSSPEMASVATRLVVLSIFAAAMGCSTDHDLLAQKPTQPGSGGSSGEGGVDGSFPTNPRNDAAPVD